MFSYVLIFLWIFCNSWPGWRSSLWWSAQHVLCTGGSAEIFPETYMFGSKWNIFWVVWPIFLKWQVFPRKWRVEERNDLGLGSAIQHVGRIQCAPNCRGSESSHKVWSQIWNGNSGTPHHRICPYNEEPKLSNLVIDAFAVPQFWDP